KFIGSCCPLKTKAPEGHRVRTRHDRGLKVLSNSHPYPSFISLAPEAALFSSSDAQKPSDVSRPQALPRCFICLVLTKALDSQQPGHIIQYRRMTAECELRRPIC